MCMQGVFHIAFRPHTSRVPSSILSLGYSLPGVSVHIKWCIVKNKLPVCVCVAWCHAVDWCPIQNVFQPGVGSLDWLQIDRDLGQAMWKVYEFPQAVYSIPI